MEVEINPKSVYWRLFSLNFTGW